MGSDEWSLVDESCRSAALLGSGAAFGCLLSIECCGGVTDRTVRASLTTIEAPSYEMPAVKLGRDWAAATVGTTMNISNAFTGLASVTAQGGQTGVKTYGGRVGLNYRIN